MSHADARDADGCSTVECAGHAARPPCCSASAAPSPAVALRDTPAAPTVRARTDDAPMPYPCGPCVAWRGSSDAATGSGRSARGSSRFVLAVVDSPIAPRVPLLERVAVFRERSDLLLGQRLRSPPSQNAVEQCEQIHRVNSLCVCVESCVRDTPSQVPGEGRRGRRFPLRLALPTTARGNGEPDRHSGNDFPAYLSKSVRSRGPIAACLSSDKVRPAPDRTESLGEPRCIELRRREHSASIRT